MKMKKIQSMSDIITNSSNEVFIVNKQDYIHYIDKFDKDLEDCFDCHKMTLEWIGGREWFHPENPGDIHWEETLHLLGISYEDAAKDGLKIVEKTYEYGSTIEKYWAEDVDYDFDYSTATKKERDAYEKSFEKQTYDFHESFVRFCKKHMEELKEKVLGKYWMNVEDHFNGWSDFKKEITENGYLYWESRH